MQRHSALHLNTDLTLTKVSIHVWHTELSILKQNSQLRNTHYRSGCSAEQTLLRKASELNQIPNHILHRAKTWILHHLTLLLKISLRLEYYLKHCCQFNMIVLHKSDKDNYTIAKTYRSIALLNTVRKVMKSVMTKRLHYMTETEGLLSDTYMRERKKCSVNTAVQLLVKKTKAVWGKCHELNSY